MGPIHYFGALESVNITYNVFSPWGEPLAASAIVEIAHQPLAFGDGGVEIDPEDCNIKTINQKKKKFYWIHWKRGTKGIKHYANMILDHLEKEQREANGEKVESQKEGE